LTLCKRELWVSAPSLPAQQTSTKTVVAQLEATQVTGVGEHMRRVGTCCAAAFDQPFSLAELGEGVQQQVFGVALDEPVPEAREHREVEAGVVNFQSQQV